MQGVHHGLPRKKQGRGRVHQSCAPIPSEFRGVIGGDGYSCHSSVFFELVFPVSDLLVELFEFLVLFLLRSSPVVVFSLVGSPRLRVAAGSLRLLLVLFSVGFPGTHCRPGRLRGLVGLPEVRHVLEGFREGCLGSYVMESRSLASAFASGLFGWISSPTTCFDRFRGIFLVERCPQGGEICGV